MALQPLYGCQVLSLALNLPGPLAVAQLHQLGAIAIKLEPPGGDPLAHARPLWYDQLHQGIVVETLDLRKSESRELLHDHLECSDLLITAMRPAALQRLSLDWPALHGRYPRLCQVAVEGYPSPREDLPGHDLSFQASAGLVEPPQLPRSCLADFGGAQQVVSSALALLLARERGQEAAFVRVSLAAVAEEFAVPWRQKLTTPDGVLGGALPGYGVYAASAGWVAIAALEPHFWEKLTAALGLAPNANRQQLQQVFLTKTAAEWESWAVNRGLPVVAVKGRDA